MFGSIEIIKLLLGSGKIPLYLKTQGLKSIYRNKRSYDTTYDNYEKLAIKSLKELIEIGNQNLQDREIIMTKYFWWLRLKILHNIYIEGDPFELALQLDQ